MIKGYREKGTRVNEKQWHDESKKEFKNMSQRNWKEQEKDRKQGQWNNVRQSSGERGRKRVKVTKWKWTRLKGRQKRRNRKTEKNTREKTWARRKVESEVKQWKSTDRKKIKEIQNKGRKIEIRTHDLKTERKNKNSVNRCVVQMPTADQAGVPWPPLSASWPHTWPVLL